MTNLARLWLLAILPNSNFKIELKIELKAICKRRNVWTIKKLLLWMEQSPMCVSLQTYIISILNRFQPIKLIHFASLRLSPIFFELLHWTSRHSWILALDLPLYISSFLCFFVQSHSCRNNKKKFITFIRTQTKTQWQ